MDNKKSIGCRFLLHTCASSECEVTGRDIELDDDFVSDIENIHALKPGRMLFSPKKVTIKYFDGPKEKTVFPDYNFEIKEVLPDGLRLDAQFSSHHQETFDITFDEPEHSYSMSFGRYNYYYRLTMKELKK